MDQLKKYETYLVSGAVGVALGLATKNILKMESVNVNTLKAGAFSFSTLAVASYLSEAILKDMNKV